MPLKRDPELLRIPAFMRKRTIRAQVKKPLVMTAYDRKQAGILPPGLQKKSRAKKKKHVRTKVTAAQVPKRKSRITRKIPKKTTETFSAPLLDFYTEPAVPPKRQKKIGAITHYYDKIQVGVIKLTNTLLVGDCITYETMHGPYEEVVESMEINRNPVFKAGKGKEIGIKLRRVPAVGCIVLK